MSCDECAYWSALDDETGQCRRHSPRPRASDTGWRWPITNWDDWCGEWEPDDEPVCDCDDDEACKVCEPDAIHIDIDEAFTALVNQLDNNDTHRRRWWRRGK